MGYQGEYKKKTGEGVFSGNDMVSDGCVVMWKSNKFRLVKKYLMEYSRAADATANKIDF